MARSPEFGLGKKVMKKGDVYCFGIIVLEVITGKMPGEEEDLSDWVRMVVNNDWSTDSSGLYGYVAGEATGDD